MNELDLNFIGLIIAYIKDPAIVSVCLVLVFVLREMKKDMQNHESRFQEMKQQFRKENEKIWDHIDKISERIDRWRDRN